MAPLAASRQTSLAQRTITDRPLPKRAALEVVDSDFMVAALEGRWGRAGSAPTDLLLIDPGARMAASVMDALVAATHATLSSVRVLSPAGLQEVAQIDELDLPPHTGLPLRVRHLRIERLRPAHASAALTRVWQQSRVVVVWMDRLPPRQADQWLLAVGGLVRQLGPQGPEWAIFHADAADNHTLNEALGNPHKVHLFQPPPDGAGTARRWNALFEAWERLR